MDRSLTDEHSRRVDAHLLASNPALYARTIAARHRTALLDRLARSCGWSDRHDMRRGVELARRAVGDWPPNARGSLRIEQRALVGTRSQTVGENGHSGHPR